MIRLDCKKVFFDRKKVIDAVDKATRRVLSRFGAYVRQAARTSIKKRKQPSPPGRPPAGHTGLLRRFIFFAFEPQRRDVVIGPARLHQVSFTRSGRPVRGTVPEVLEYGGRVRLLVGKRYDGSWARVDLRRRRRYRQTRMMSVRIAARPYMRPALARELPRLPGMWKDSIKRK